MKPEEKIMKPEEPETDITRSEGLLYHIKKVAFSSVYWSRKVSSYQLVGLVEYAPMIEDELFTKFFSGSDTVGTIELEKALGRKIRVEDLYVCPLSVSYLIFDRPELTGSQKEYDKLRQFLELVTKSIERNEARTLKIMIKRLQGELAARE